MVGRPHFSHKWGEKFKKNWTERTTLERFYLFPKQYPRSMRLTFFDHRTLFCSPNCQFFCNCAHFWWARSTLALSEDKIKKKWTERTTLDKFLYISRKKYPCSIRLNIFAHRIFFWSPDRQFQSNYAYCWWAGSTSAKAGDKIKKNDWTNHIGQVLFFPKKKFPRSMRLNFFDHRTLFWSPNCQFQSNCAHFWLAGSTLAVVVNKIRKNGLNGRLWTNFIYFQKKVSLLDHA